MRVGVGTGGIYMIEKYRKYHMKIFSENFVKTLDATHLVCYNKSTRICSVSSTY